jgi:hypothetical protein
MANISRVNGFRAVRHNSGAPYSGQMTQYAMLASDATNCFIGDIVKFTGLSDANGIPAVTTITAATDVPVGVVMGFSFNPQNLNIRYRAASTAQYAYVVDSPDVIFETQTNGATAITDAGLNASPVIAAGSTATGVSSFQLDSSTKATTNTLMLSIHRFVPRADNDPTSQYGRVEVMFNKHQFAFGATDV